MGDIVIISIMGGAYSGLKPITGLLSFKYADMSRKVMQITL